MPVFHLVTVLPESYKSYLDASVLGRAIQDRKIKIRFYNPRDFAGRQVDDRPYGGGAGMVLKAPPILAAVARALRAVKTGEKKKIIVLSAKGKPFNQKRAAAWAKINHLIMITGRYEGIDERVRLALRAEEISIGSYVLTDGDVAAMACISATARLVPGVIRLESLVEESHWNLLLRREQRTQVGRGLEYPHYTRPEIFIWKGKKYRVPGILLSGKHREIAVWRRNFN